MTGYVIDPQGAETMLPPLLRWNLTATTGEAADCFSLTFVFAARWEPVLKQAVMFRAMDKGKTRFYGIVDEYEITHDREGLLVTLHGRGMAGRLMDNQVGQRDYYWVSLGNILGEYVYPYGITKVQYDEDWWLTIYSVPYGATAWQALQGFCLWAGGVQPRFLPDGTLVISGKEGAKRRLERPDKVLTARFSCCRYGVYSKVVAKSVATGVETHVDNVPFQALGGQAVGRMTIPRRRSCSASKVSPRQMLEASQEDFRVLEIELGELYAAEPGDIVSVNLGKLGISGAFQVKEAENSLSPEGKLCRLTMKEI